MHNPAQRPGLAEGLPVPPPLTHCDYIAAAGRSTGRPWVQIRRRFEDVPVALCGQVIELRESDREWFKVITPIGTYWTDSRNTRMCSGDGRCTCESAAATQGDPCCT